MNNVDISESEMIAIKLGQQASDNIDELRSWLSDAEYMRAQYKRKRDNKKEDRTLASKYIVEFHKGENVTEEVIKKSIEEIENIMMEKSLMYDQILVYTPSETIVCGFRNGKKITYVVDYVTGE